MSSPHGLSKHGALTMSQSLDRALTIISLCAERPRTLDELAGHLDIHRSTAFRLIQTMEKRGFMRRGPDTTWQVGLGLTSMVMGALDAVELRTVAQPHLLDLSREVGHTLHLAELSGPGLVYVDKVEGRGSVRMLSWVGAPVVVHTAGVAKAILAFSRPAVRDSLLAPVRFERYTDATITDRETYLAQLALVRERGWAHDNGELEHYLNCVAVPILDSSGHARGSLSITALRDIEPLTQLQGHIPLLREAAHQIALGMGWNRTAS